MTGFLPQKRSFVLFSLFWLMLYALILLPVTVTAAQPNKKPKGPKPVGAVNSGNGGVYNPGQYGIIFKYITFTQDQLYEGSDEVTFVRPGKARPGMGKPSMGKPGMGKPGMGMGRPVMGKPGMGKKKPGKKTYEKSLNRYQVILRTGIFKNFDARVIIPYMDKELNRQSAMADFSDSGTGLGDITAFGRYRLMSQKQKDPFNLAVGIGLEMPTGKTDEKDSSGKTPGYIQPGGGAWNPILEVGAHKVMGPHWIGGHILYKMTTEGEVGKKDFERPDVFKYNLSYGYAISKAFDLQLELNGEVKTKAKMEGKTVDSSGGHTVFVTPGVHYKIKKGIHFGLAAPITIYRDLNGTQPSEDYRIVAKLAMKF